MAELTKLVHFTLAAEDVHGARNFYSGVFGDAFDAVDIQGVTLYRGSLAGLGMVICPASMADVVANRSRHQFQLEVDDVALLVERAAAHGGRVHTPLMDHGGRSYAVVCDPDNNTIELIGAA
jgi:predicted enzyme related to lactoylglutathione lyase